MKNQFGQKVEVGDVVGYTTRRGSVTTRKVGIVTGFGVRNSWNGPETSVYVNWRLDGTFTHVQNVDQKGAGVSIKRIFVLAPIDWTDH